MTREQAEALGRWALAAGWEHHRRQLSFPLPSDFGPPVPDFRDETGATRGILLEQVREAWGQPHLYCLYSEPHGQWCVTFGKGYVAWADTEPEALVAALEAKP